VNKENKKSYLPSPQFRARIILLLILIVVVSGSMSIYNYFKNKKDSTPTGLPTHTIRVSDDIMVSDIVAKDTNLNGIPDWEESLWGLNPTTDGQKNKEFIESKRAESASGIDTNSISSAEPENETDRLAREFFSSFMALKQSNTLNTNAIQNIGDSIGQKVGSTNLPDIYLVNEIKTVAASKAALQKYQSDLEKVTTKYQNADFGNELAIMADAMQNEEPTSAQDLSTIANTYRSMAKEMSKITTPKNVIRDHLELVNSYAKMGTALDKMSEVLDNPIVATTGTVMYARYTKEINQIVESIKTTFIDNGILSKDAN
jgi:hypothetical protein